MNTFQLATVLISVGVGCLVGGLIAAIVSFFMSRTNAVKVSEVIGISSNQVEQLRTELTKLRLAVVALTEVVDEVMAPLVNSGDSRIDPDSAWKLIQVNRATKVAMR